MDWKKDLLATLLVCGLASATVITLGFLLYGIWIMPSTISNTNIRYPPNSQFFLCANGSVQDGFCETFSLNASTNEANATLNVTWQQGNGTVCTVKFFDSDIVELADFSQNVVYTLPNEYPAGATFSLRIKRLNSTAGNCWFTVLPVEG